MLDRFASVNFSQVAARSHDVVDSFNRAVGRYTPTEVALLLNRSAGCWRGQVDPARAQTILACATQPSEWAGRLDSGTEWKLGLRLYYRLPTIVAWYLAGLSPDEIGDRISMFGGPASALRALDAASRCIARRLNDRGLPPIRGAGWRG
jgi:hypothetical protein